MGVNSKKKVTNRRKSTNKYRGASKNDTIGQKLSNFAVKALCIVRLTLVVGAVAGCLAGVSALLVFGFQLLTASHYFEVRTVVLAGINHVQKQDVIDLSGFESRPTNTLTMSLRKTAEAITAHPWVKDVKIVRRLPSEVYIEITEFEPRAILDLDGLYLVDETGKPFKKLEKSDMVRLPVIKGVAKRDFIFDEERVKVQLSEVFALFSVLEQRNDRLGLDSIAQAEIDPVRGILLTTRDGLTIKVGLGDYELKLRRFGRVLAFLKARDQASDLAFADLDCGQRVVIRRSVSG